MTKHEKQKIIKGFKTILVGNSQVGKSTFLVRYTEGYFSPQVATVGLDFRVKQVQKNGQKFNLELYDTAGQQRFKTIVFSYFKLAKAACVVFDITNIKSLQDTKSWFKQVGNSCGDDIPKVLIGNKSDLLSTLQDKQKHMQQITPLIQQIEKQFNAKYFLASSKTGDNVRQIFDYLFEELYKIHSRTNSKQKQSGAFSLKPKSVKAQKEKSCCN